MSLSVGIVGLPNVGKSTLFNALLKKQQAYAANFPFATIEPNIGVVPVSDARLGKLAEIIKKSEGLEKIPPEVPATIEFVDIAGLIAGAHKGEGLGNKFLAHIREVDAIIHVVRAFTDENIVKEGVVDPESDLETIETELVLADFATLENIEKKLKKENNPHKVSAHKKLTQALGEGKLAKDVNLTKDERKEVKEFFLLTAKPKIVVLNIGEDDLSDKDNLEREYSQKFGIPIDSVIALSAKLEEDLASLSSKDQIEYLFGHGIKATGLERGIRKAFDTLGLITYLTAGEKEIRAWTVKRGTFAPQASGAIHSDFEKKFIKAEVCAFQDFIESGGWRGSREKGKTRSEGKEYKVKDGDVIDFKIGA